MREKFEKHVQATSVCWVEEMRERLFEVGPMGYLWPRLESRFVDFQAGHAAGLVAAQRLRDALKLARVPIVSDCTSFSTHRPLLVTMDDALADFDKETE